MTLFWRWALNRLVDLLGHMLRRRLAETAPQPMAWGRAVSPEFRARVAGLARALRTDPSILMAIMAFESGRSFSPSIVNPASGATGLIQVMPGTARALGTTTEALARMTALEQLDYVERYLAPHAGRLGDLASAYMAVLWPAAVRKPLSHVIFAAPSTAYRQNRGLDTDRDGKITKAEAAARVQRLLVEGMRPDNFG